jgi:hypothetical protein
LKFFFWFKEIRLDDCYVFQALSLSESGARLPQIIDIRIDLRKPSNKQRQKVALPKIKTRLRDYYLGCLTKEIFLAETIKRSSF